MDKVTKWLSDKWNQTKQFTQNIFKHTTTTSFVAVFSNIYFFYIGICLVTLNPLNPTVVLVYALPAAIGVGLLVMDAVWELKTQ